MRASIRWLLGPRRTSTGGGICNGTRISCISYAGAVYMICSSHGLIMRRCIRITSRPTGSVHAEASPHSGSATSSMSSALIGASWLLIALYGGHILQFSSSTSSIVFSLLAEGNNWLCLVKSYLFQDRRRQSLHFLKCLQLPRSRAYEAF